MQGCSSIPLVSAYYDGELSLARRAEFARHLASCSECMAELEELKNLSEAIATRSLPPPLSGEGLSRLHHHVDELTDRSLLRFAELLSGIAAAVLITALIWVAKPVRVSAEPVPQWERAAVTLEPEQAANAGPIRTVVWMVSELSPSQDGQSGDRSQWGSGPTSEQVR